MKEFEIVPHVELTDQTTLGETLGIPKDRLKELFEQMTKIDDKYIKISHEKDGIRIVFDTNMLVIEYSKLAVSINELKYVMVQAGSIIETVQEKIAKLKQLGHIIPQLEMIKQHIKTTEAINKQDGNPRHN